MLTPSLLALGLRLIDDATGTPAPAPSNGFVDFLSGIGNFLWPIKWVIEAILVGFHWVMTNVFEMDPAGGWTWILSIVGLVIVVRAATIPLFVRQIKSQRKMLEVAPQLKKIQDKYKGKTDQFSREAQQRETMELYRQNGTNPFASCLPLIISLPIFITLSSVLSNAETGKAGVGLLSEELAQQFRGASIFDGLAPLNLSIQAAISANPVNWIVVVIAGIMVALMIGSQFFTQLQLVSRNLAPATKESPMYRQQRILLYIIPLMLLFTGFTFPIGLMFYWLASNIWTVVQQWLVIRTMPTPGSEAALAREARLAKRARAKMAEDAEALEASDDEPAKKVTTQRQQPVGRSRAKKQGGKQ